MLFGSYDSLAYDLQSTWSGPAYNIIDVVEIDYNDIGVRDISSSMIWINDDVIFSTL